MVGFFFGVRASRENLEYSTSKWVQRQELQSTLCMWRLVGSAAASLLFLPPVFDTERRDLFVFCTAERRQNKEALFSFSLCLSVCVYTVNHAQVSTEIQKKNCFRNPYLAASNPFCSERPDYENELNAENDEHYFMKLCNSRIICNRHRSIMTCFWCMCTTREILLFDVSVCVRMCVSSTVF